MYLCTRNSDIRSVAKQKDRDLAQLVAHTSGGREVAGSSPVIPTKRKSKRLSVVWISFFQKLAFFWRVNKIRNVVDCGQFPLHGCEPLPTAVIPIRAEAASLVEGSCVPSVASDQRSSETFRSYSLLISFFYTKGTVPFVLSSYQIT